VKLELHLVNLELVGIVEDIEARGLAIRDHAAHEQFIVGELIDLRLVVAGMDEIEALIVGE
jgi:hypothetical protein